MRNSFKKMADKNSHDIQQHLGEFIEGSWKTAQKCSKQVSICLQSIKSSQKQLECTAMLYNSISDLFCCLDAFERGHDRTISNNLRMILEDYCCVIQINKDEAAYKQFSNNKHLASKSVGYAKKTHENRKFLGNLYGELSKISHHNGKHLLARQTVSIKNGCELYSHLKPIDPNRLYGQINHLLMINHLFLSIAELAEEICINNLETPYFLTKSKDGWQRNLNTKECEFIQKLTLKAQQILGN